MGRMLNTKEEVGVRHVIAKLTENGLNYGVKVYREEPFDRMTDVTYEIMEYIFETSAHNGLWAREEGLYINKEQLNVFVDILENKGCEVMVYNRVNRKELVQ